MNMNTRPELASTVDTEKLVSSGHVDVLIETESGDVSTEKLEFIPDSVDIESSAFTGDDLAGPPPLQITDTPFDMPDFPVTEDYLLDPETEAAPAKPPPRPATSSTGTPAGRIERSLGRQSA